MNVQRILDNVFARITSIVIVIAVLVGCNNIPQVLLGVLPIAEALVLQYLPVYSYAINFGFGVFRVFVLVLVNNRPSPPSSAELLDYLDVVAIFLMSPSLLLDKGKNLNHIFLYIIFVQQQGVNDTENHVYFRFVSKMMCFLSFSLNGFSKICALDRLYEKLNTHYLLKSKLDTQKQNLTKALQSAVGWKTFKRDFSVDTYLFVTNARMNYRHHLHQEEETTLKNRLLNSTILKQHNISKFQRTMDATRSYNKVSRTDCILIAIKPFVDNTLTSCKAQNVYDMFKISSKIDSLAKLHRITVVRKFGDVWIGCLGFFPNVDRAVSENLQDVLGMARDIHLYGEQNNFKFTCALDCGNIFCGFFRGIFQFEVLGPEVMWIISVCEYERKKEIFVSDSMHALCKRLLSNPNNPYKFESILLQHVDKFHSGSNYVLILDYNKMQVVRPKSARFSSENILMEDKVCDVNYNLVTRNGQHPPNSHGELHLGISEESQLHMLSTLAILHSLVYDDLHYRARSMLKKVKAIFVRGPATVSPNTNMTSTTTSLSPSTNNVLLSPGATPPLRRRQGQSPSQIGAGKEQPHSHTSLFDGYPSMSFDVGTNMSLRMKCFCKKIVSFGRLEALYGHYFGFSSNESARPDTHTPSEMSESKGFESFRKQFLEPTGYFFNGYVAISLLCSLWMVLLILVDVSTNEGTVLNKLALNIMCLFVVTSFFNWSMPLLDSSSLLFPVCNVVIFCMFPECAMSGDLAAMVIVPTWMVLCYSHRLSHMACSILVVLVIVGVKRHTDECKGGVGSIVFALLGIFFLSALFILEYILYLCYIVEMILIPYEREVLLCYEETIKEIHQQRPMKTPQRGSGKSTGSLNNVVSGKSQPTNALTKRFHCFQRCVVIAVHVKAAETIPDVGAVDLISNMLEYIYSLFDECIDKFGIVGMSKFSGVHLSAIRDDDDNNGSNLKRGVACVQFILMKFRQLDQQNYVNLKLGLCLNYGPLNLGMFEDNSRVYFDMTGPTRDKALQMAVKEENDIFFSDSFLNEMKIAFPNKQLRESFVEGGGADPHFSSSNIKWNQLEVFDAFNFAGNFGFSRNMKDYNYKERLGKGGNGTVHLLEDQINKTLVAVKIIEWNAASMDHTRRELSILQDLKHQNIVKIKFCVVKRVEMFIVMEYIRGGTLQQIVDYYKSDFETIRVWFMQLVLALEYIHERGIIHRDVKPSNCMIDTFGILKLTDFGLALQDIDTSLTDGEDTNANEELSQQHAPNEESGVSLSAPSLKLMQNIFPSSVQYNTTVSGNNRLKEGILLVDDDRQRLEKTQSLLRQHFIVYSVNNDDEALDFLEHSIKNVNNDNEISLIIISIDVIGDHINGWGFLNTLWSSEEFKDIPVIALASSLSLELNKSKIWEERLPNIKERPKQILYHPFDSEAYEANRYYFDMVCRLEKQRKNLGDVKASTVFDKMFSDTYYSSKQQHRAPSEKTEKQNMLRDVISTKRDNVAGTINYMAPEVIKKEECNEKIDWWSCGATFYYCVMGKKLFDRNSKYSVVREILNIDIGDRLSRCYNVPADLKDLMHNMLLRDVSRRFNSVSIKKHHFFKSVGNVSKGAVKKVFDPIATCKLKNVTRGPFSGPDLDPQAASLPQSESMGFSTNFEESETKGNSIHTSLRYSSSEVRLRDRWTMAPPALP